MKLGNDIMVDVANLRSIIHGIRMSGLSYVDPEAMPYIQEAIKKLPSAETISEISGDKQAIKNLANQVGEILQLIEIYGKRGEEMKQRHKSLKKLPPRYKVLDWRKQNMNIATSGLIRSMVRVSSTLDSKGKGDLSQKVLVCAKNLKDDRATISEVESLINEVTSSGQEDLLKEAGILDGVKDWAAGVKGGMQGAWEGAKTMGHMIGDPVSLGKSFAKSLSFVTNIDKNIAALIQSLTESEAFIRNPAMKQAVGAIKNEVSKLTTNSNQIKAALAEQTKAVQQSQQQTTVPANQQGQQQGQQQEQQQQVNPQTTSSWEDEAKKAGWRPPAAKKVPVKTAPVTQ